jgi:hypothetical protein
MLQCLTAILPHREDIESVRISIDDCKTRNSISVSAQVNHAAVKRGVRVMDPIGNLMRQFSSCDIWIAFPCDNDTESRKIGVIGQARPAECLEDRLRVDQGRL